MPNAKQHFTGGLVVAGAVNGLSQWIEICDAPDKKFDWGEFILCSLAGGAAALVPDLLEPANTPNHRQFCHSLAAAVIVSQIISGKHTDACSPETKKLLHVLGAGYLSHLLLDCGTPKGINVI